MIIYTLKKLGISTPYQKADKIPFRTEMEKSMLICASVGFILTHVKRKEFSPTLSFIFAFHMDSSENLALPVPVKQSSYISTG